jgi:hypothetical protein
MARAENVNLSSINKFLINGTKISAAIKTSVMPMIRGTRLFL